MHDFRNGFETGATLVWIYSAFMNAMPPYTGNSYALKWLTAVMHGLGDNLDRAHTNITRKNNEPKQ